MDDKKKRINELEQSSIEITESEQQKEKTMEHRIDVKKTAQIHPDTVLRAKDGRKNHRISQKK